MTTKINTYPKFKPNKQRCEFQKGDEVTTGDWREGIISDIGSTHFKVDQKNTSLSIHWPKDKPLYHGHDLVVGVYGIKYPEKDPQTDTSEGFKIALIKSITMWDYMALTGVKKEESITKLFGDDPFKVSYKCYLCEYFGYKGTGRNSCEKCLNWSRSKTLSQCLNEDSIYLEYFNAATKEEDKAAAKKVADFLKSELERISKE